MLIVTGGILGGHNAAQKTAAQTVIQTQTARRGQAKTEFLGLNQLAGKTDAQILAYIDANVTDFASAKAAIRFLARAVGALARRGDIED